MSGRWWRAYDRSRHNPKLLKLSDRHFRWWFNLVCVASEKSGLLPPHADLAAEFRVSGKVMTEVLDALIAAELFDHSDDGIRPHDWNTLQYTSDSSSNRVKAFRERRRNVSETPSESDTESDTEKRAPRTGARLPDDWMPSAEDRAFAEQLGLNPDTVAPSFRDYWHGVAGAKGRKADWPGTWRNWCRREAESQRNRKQTPNVTGNALPPSEPWEQRMRGYKPGVKWWRANDWGPEPGQPGCRVPTSILATWREGATQ